MPSTGPASARACVPRPMCCAPCNSRPTPFIARKDASLNVQAGCWQELRARIRQADARSGSYDALCAQWQQRKQDLEDLRRRKTELETALRRTERRLSVWEQWREWHLLGMRLERLSGLPQDFPPQGRERLARLREREEEGQRALQGLREQCARTGSCARIRPL